MDKICLALDEVLREDRLLIEKTFSYSEMAKISEIKRLGEILKEEYTDEGIYIKAYVPTVLAL